MEDSTAPFVIGNKEAFQRSLDEFVEFDRRGDLDKQEREYKLKLIDTLHPVLSPTSLNAPNGIEGLRQALRRSNAYVANLTYQLDAADLREYVGKAPEDRTRQLLIQLLDERNDLASRIDEFKRDVDADFERYLENKGKTIALAMIALFLAAAFPDRYAFFRPSLINSATQKWNIPKPEGKTDGKAYVAYLPFIQQICSRLRLAKDRSPDLIDAHSFLYHNRNRLNHIIVNLSWQSDY